MQKTLILIILLLFSCNTLSDSKGEFNRIVIIVSEEDKFLVENNIDNLFSEVINTPSEEKLFKPKWIKPESFKNYLEYKNLLFISLSEPKDSTIDQLVNKFKETYENNLFVLEDIYAKNQSLIFLSSENQSTFNSLLTDHSSWIIDKINENINKNLNYYVYKNGINQEIKNTLLNYFKLEFDVQTDFLVIKDDYDLNQFFWIGRGYPYRWITFKKIQLNSDFLLFEDFKNHINNDMKNVKITDYYKNLLYESDDIIKIQGLYEEENSNTGGPFVSYVKVNSDDNTAIIITGFVNNPGKNKLRLLKELELQITKTIYRGKNE